MKNKVSHSLEKVNIFIPKTVGVQLETVSLKWRKLFKSGEPFIPDFCNKYSWSAMSRNTPQFYLPVIFFKGISSIFFSEKMRSCFDMCSWPLCNWVTIVATSKMAPVTRRTEIVAVVNAQKHVDLQIWKVEKKTCSMEHITLHLIHLRVSA